MEAPKPATLVLAQPPELRIRKQPPPPMGTRWKPGQSGNPSGRAKGSMSVTEALKLIQRGRKRCPSERARVSWNLAVGLISRARNDDGALQILLDRTEGKVTQPLDHRHVVDINRAIADAHAAALLEGSVKEPPG